MTLRTYTKASDQAAIQMMRRCVAANQFPLNRCGQRVWFEIIWLIATGAAPANPISVVSNYKLSNAICKTETRSDSIGGNRFQFAGDLFSTHGARLPFCQLWQTKNLSENSSMARGSRRRLTVIG